MKTSGVTFDRNTGMVTTAQRVNFSMTQGSGSAVGATYDSQRGYLTLVQAVELTTYRGADEVRIHAQHAEFDRGAQLCLLRAATLEYRDGQADAAQAKNPIPRRWIGGASGRDGRLYADHGDRRAPGVANGGHGL